MSLMRTESLKFLEQLLNTPSPSGFETQGQKVWLDYVKGFADETFHDDYGNCVAVLNKGGGPKVMLAAHADEIGMMVHYIDDHGFIYVKNLGGVNPAITKAQRVQILNRKGVIKGVIGNVAPHLMKADNADPKPPKMHEIFIDIGVSSKKEALKFVSIGDPIVLSGTFEVLRDDLIVARALDNRVGTFAVAEALRLLSGQKSKIKAEICVVSNIMEEVGLFGARQIAYSLKPDLALVVDVTHATDYPTVSKSMHGDVRIGKGPTLTHGGSNHPVLVERLEKVADKKGIPLQHEAVSGTSGTDTDVVFWTRGGIPSALISLPNRYMHSPVEIVSLKDLQHIPDLMAGFCLSIKKGEQFRVKI